MKHTFIFFSISILAILSLEGSSIKNQALLKTLKSSPRWVILPLVEDQENGSKLAKHHQEWVHQKEAELQDMDLEIVTLSRKEQSQAIKAWSAPFTSRLNKDLISLCQSLNSNLLTAYYSPDQANSLSYVVYSLKKQKQLTFRSSQDNPLLKKKQTHPEPPQPAKITKKVDPKPAPKKVEPKTTSKRIESYTQSSSFSDELKDWFSQKVKPEGTREISSDKRRRRGNHPEIMKQKQEELHKALMQNKKLHAYASSEKAKGEQALEATCLEHLKQADDSWMSSSKFEHLSRAYVLNQSLKEPNTQLKDHLLKELIDRNEFLNDWDSDVSN